MQTKKRRSDKNDFESPDNQVDKSSCSLRRSEPIQCFFAPTERSKDVNNHHAKKIALNRTGMPDRLKRGLENLSGFDLSSVRVHYNSKKPAQIGALAYTQGNQIHLGPGQNKHLPHEGWHAVQQMQGRVNPTRQFKRTPMNDNQQLENEADSMGAKAQRLKLRNNADEIVNNHEYSSTSSVVQRAVGFEFQTNWNIHKTRWFGQDPVEYAKKTLLFRGDGWQMETDGNEIEYVVDQVEEARDPLGTARLTNVMTNLENFVGNLNGMRNTNGGDLRNNHLTGQNINLSKSNFKITTSGQNIAANPQVTAGVRMDRITKLYQSLGTANSTSGDEFLGQAPAFYRSKVNTARQNANTDDPAWGNHTPSAKLQGLLTLIAQYLVTGSSPGSLITAKYMAFVMARTDFGAMFNQLDDGEKNYYSANRDAWVTYVCDDVMNNLDRNQPVINREIHDDMNLAHGQRITIPITRANWLSNIARGRDLLTKRANEVYFFSGSQHKATYMDSRENLGHRLRGFGGLGDTFDDLLNGQTGAILEFRSMRGGVPYRNWQPLAIQAYQYFRAINQLNDGDPLPVF
ncbi:MAG: DUF4157 domain-containing protein, partial [Proteobacteria bacterium]|nr:DUF4157 domain-containing protein [Pseudomonadota bacterium]